MINCMVNLYRKSLWFVYLFSLIAIGITVLLYCIPVTVIRVILMTIWWGTSLSIMIDSLVKWKYGNNKEN